ncbi:DarT1-associated NADAR antitoxin family protein [Lactococcus lactis]|uniref:DarT1-associated NADAR antitoxin family protein n=1 Tax=Lactococcus lactis TaxID=1358 RepID=UPI00210C4D1D|nr:hypothetical protein [Lactococcus lactis]MCQ4972472.1 hypothetical protein [Lactococcus lactis]MCQ4998278.1 hypothetical protein [Lactococcus lactis]
MATRPVFLPMDSKESKLIKKIDVDFEWYPGFSISQKQKSIKSLHQKIKTRELGKKVLEISTKSPTDLGVELSAFNLKIQTKKEIYFTVESAFQSSKVFENGGPYDDLLLKGSREAKKDIRLKSSGKVIGFKYLNREFPSEPKTFFYNWLYVNALDKNQKLSKELLSYDSFTDIEFNPEKSINCQAEAAALYVSLSHKKLLTTALSSIKNFKEIVYSDRLYKSNKIEKKPDNPAKPDKIKQLDIFDSI